MWSFLMTPLKGKGLSQRAGSWPLTPPGVASSLAPFLACPALIPQVSLGARGLAPDLSLQGALGLGSLLSPHLSLSTSSLSWNPVALFRPRAPAHHVPSTQPRAYFMGGLRTH